MPSINRDMPQRGGAVRTLHGLYPDAATMEADMDFYSVGCHGATVGDETFFMVPPETYFLFTAHSGDYANSFGEPEVDETISRAEDRTAYYQMLYDRFFTEGGSKFSPDLYIYEPGDLLPDYVLSFSNNLQFFSQFGVYALPMKPSVTGVATEYFGRPVTYIKRLLEAGVLKEEDVAGLTGQVAHDLKTKTVAEIDDTRYVDTFDQLLEPSYNIRKAHLERVQELEDTNDEAAADRNPITFKEMGLFDKLNYICCLSNPDNLVRDILKPSKGYQVRLINLMRHPAIAGRAGHKRFFVMHFCRGSISDMGIAYTNPHPHLIRALSFSGKCSDMRKREEALNIIRLTQAVCNLEPAQKSALVQTVDGRRLIAILKRIANIDWKKCLPPMTYAAVDSYDRLDFISDYVGYLMMPEVLDLVTFHKTLSDFPVIQRHLASLASEFEKKVITKIDALRKEKADLIHSIYQDVHTVTGFGFIKSNKPGTPDKIDDFLSLHFLSVGYIKRIQIFIKNNLSDKENPAYIDLVYTGDRREDAKRKADLKELFVFEEDKDTRLNYYEPVEIPVIKDESVTMGHISPAEGGGRKRQTRKRRRLTRHKRKTASIKLNPLTRRLLRNRLRKDKR